ncbi:MAG: adenosine kinase [Pseudomonadota bacterium]|nr:adenosine kinase [Pseudomonadota bacterium]
MENQGIVKGVMTLIDAESVERLYTNLKNPIECSGGSAANTIAGIASLGGEGAFVGKVFDDYFGKIFNQDIKSLGVTFNSLPATAGPPTATSIILVTPDAERTMMTFLGACVNLGVLDIDEELIESSKITYLEGYLWDRPSAKEAILKACYAAHKAGRKISLSLSDPFCVDRHRNEFRDLILQHVDILFANEEEILSLYDTNHLKTAINHIQAYCEIAVVTLGEKGSIVISGEEILQIDVEPVEKLIDTTGAGDAYAAGFLYGITSGQNLSVSGRLGSICAAEVVSHLGARPELSLKNVIREKFS